mgnify:CR=1 FL=1
MNRMCVLLLAQAYYIHQSAESYKLQCLDVKSISRLIVSRMPSILKMDKRQYLLLQDIFRDLPQKDIRLPLICLISRMSKPFRPVHLESLQIPYSLGLQKLL